MATSRRYRFPHTSYVRRIRGVAVDIRSWSNAYWTMAFEDLPDYKEPGWKNRAEARSKYLEDLSIELANLADHFEHYLP